ncbi:hypothetical protein [Hymenobacter daeguensis]
MKVISTEFHNGHFWHRDQVTGVAKRLVFHNGSEVVVTVNSDQDLYPEDPQNIPCAELENPSQADEERAAYFAALTKKAEEKKGQYFEALRIMKRGEVLFFQISAGTVHTNGRKKRIVSWFEVELLEDLYLTRKTRTGAGTVADCKCVVRRELDQRLTFFEPVYAYSLNDAYSKTYVLYFNIFGKGTTNVYTHFYLGSQEAGPSEEPLEKLRKFKKQEAARADSA